MRCSSLWRLLGNLLDFPAVFGHDSLCLLDGLVLDGAREVLGSVFCCGAIGRGGDTVNIAASRRICCSCTDGGNIQTRSA